MINEFELIFGENDDGEKGIFLSLREFAQARHTRGMSCPDDTINERADAYIAEVENTNA